MTTSASVVVSLPIVAIVPIRIESLNKTYSEHWTKRSNRNTSHRAAVWFALKAAAGRDRRVSDMLPCTVTLTRIAPRSIDQHDNLRAGCKSAVDAIADLLNVDDADARVTWVYAQRKGAPHSYALEVSIALTKRQEIEA